MERSLKRKLKCVLQTEIYTEDYAGDYTEDALERLLLKAREEIDRTGKRRHISFWNMMLQQVKYIGWKVWLLQVLVCIFFHGIFVAYAGAWSDRGIAILLSILSLTVAVMFLPALYRSMHYRMFELEGATWFSIRRVLLARVLIFYVGDAVILCTVGRAARMLHAVSWDMLLLWLGMPCLVCTAGLLYFMRKEELERLKTYYGCFCAAVFCFCFLLWKYGSSLMSRCTVWQEVTLMTVLFGYELYQVRRLIRYDAVFMA